MNSETLLLFDIDGTLTTPRLPISEAMKQFLKQLRRIVDIGIVGGSDQAKAQEQLGEDILDSFEYCFFENGLVAYNNGTLIHKEDIVQKLGDAKLQEFINYCLRYIAELDIPVKRGTFIEFRSGMLNISPIGRNCTQKERLDFNEYDKKYGIREKFVKSLQGRFADYDLCYSIGGQISFDVFPRGWDKTYCLQHIPSGSYKEIHFFGDKTSPGENDYEIYISELVQGHKVEGPGDTRRKVIDILEHIYQHDS